MNYYRYEAAGRADSEGFGSSTSGWVEPETDMSAGNDAAPSGLPLVIVGGEAPERSHFVGVRRVGPIAPLAAAEHLRGMARPGILWLRHAERLERAVLVELGDAMAERDCGFMCETTVADLDRILPIIPSSVRSEWLVDPEPVDREIAVAALRHGRQMEVNDVARDEAMERIDRLQEEVARISRLLGDLAGPRGLPGTPIDYGARADRAADLPEQLRSASRDFAAMPRSFEPQERAADRERAKAVRRILRHRRMREQYFPADLFADPSWDMLLDLYAARLERQPVSVSSLCIAAAVPATTALRWIKTMTEAGLFVRESDPNDGRRIFIALTQPTFESMGRYFEALDE